MINLFSGFRDLLIGIAVSAGVAVNSIVPTPIGNKLLSPIQSPQEASKPAIISPVGTPASAPTINSESPTPVPTPLTLNGDNYIYVQGQYSFLFQSVKYLFLVPKKGGSFSGAAQGFCQAQIGGEYEGGNGGKISGKASGDCNFLGVKYKGSTNFKGHLYPETKTIEIGIPNSPLKGPIKVNYN